MSATLEAYAASPLGDRASADQDVTLLVASMPPRDPGERGRGIVVLNAAAQLYVSHHPVQESLSRPPTPIQHFRRQDVGTRERYIDTARAVLEALYSSD